MKNFSFILLFTYSPLWAIDFNIDIPPLPPSLQTQEKSKPIYSKPPLSKTPSVQNETYPYKFPYDLKSFPEYSCIKPAMDFWIKVYTQVDENSAIFHDRDNVSRIYGVIRVTQTQNQEYYRKYISKNLKYMAENLDIKNSWNEEHHALSKLFEGKLLNKVNLLRASQSIRSQRGLKNQFYLGIERSLPMLQEISQIFIQHHLPLDLIYLPHVESSYNIKAYSKVGAAGLWQIMPATMKHVMGASMVHKRNDLTISTQAAAKILKSNSQILPSWPLALTAYNHGTGGVQRAVKQTQSEDFCTIITKYESPSFRFASSHFYAQFLAARKSAIEAYEIKLEQGSEILKKISLRSQKYPQNL